ncbi:flagellar motor switch protein FliN [Bordetella hinzii]|uniref:Flagellar motor switch protein FliN n=2 Tax=Bordetella hinzii TaxID=103855 RepID=A0AAN1RYE5_9BORD|nr:flagellar motor switch protein FliN [Bordetella hinzii]AKQ55981.1 Flagellar motor switch protein FliN [Bordetella hinzii]AKQ60513.1 Flagellar motor switch protein FliN [Bordetella hinzii]AZW18441.1 flagellar motor switch protein FliN [Bordetella hinzii]KCB25645.1 flagellar motor switch protein FliN [Bordetella hinzii OH87 BAL007II]KCB32856.1 flagellar motor switch protein FliN [Bordetella hinzii L60]
MTDTNERPDQTGASAPSSAADDWADALAEQSRNAPPTQADGLRGQDDWASAMAEQNAAAPAAPAAAPAPQSAAQTVFKPLTSKENAGGADIDLIMDVPVQLTVELGRTRLTIKNLLQLGQGSVVELDGLAGEPMDIFVNGYLIAQGEVVVVEDKYGIRLTDIITPSERINRLNNRR